MFYLYKPKQSITIIVIEENKVCKFYVIKDKNAKNINE